MSLDLQKEARAVLLDVFLDVCANALSHVKESSLSHLRLAIVLSLFVTSVCQVLLGIAHIIDDILVLVRD